MTRYACAFLALLLAACEQGIVIPSEAVAGSYDLESVNGIAVPAIFQEEFDGVLYTFSITEGGLELAGGAFTGTLAFEEAEDGEVVFQASIPLAGTYAVEGSTVTFTLSETEEVLVATRSGNMLTMTFEEEGQTLSLVYRK